MKLGGIVILLAAICMLCACNIAGPSGEAAESISGAQSSLDPNSIESHSESSSDPVESSSGAQSWSCGEGDNEDDEGNMLENGHYVDNALINYVGLTAYDEWLRLPSDHTKTVYEMLEHFEITDEMLKEIVHESIYEWYMKYKPK